MKCGLYLVPMGPLDWPFLCRFSSCGNWARLSCWPIPLPPRPPRPTLKWKNGAPLFAVCPLGSLHAFEVGIIDSASEVRTARQERALSLGDAAYPRLGDEHSSLPPPKCEVLAHCTVKVPKWFLSLCGLCFCGQWLESKSCHQLFIRLWA